METYITICKIDSQLEFAIWLRKLKQGLCVNKEWWDGEGDGREVQEGGDICIPTGDRDQDHPHGKEMQKSKMAVWGGLINSCEKKRSKKQSRKGKI